MRARNLQAALVMLVTMLATAPPVLAQPKVEVGGTLASLVVGLDDDDNDTIIGIPSATFGIFNPGVYASFFLGDHAAVEPQIGLLWASSGGHSNHVLTAAAQFDYFIAGTEVRSPYVFVAGGITDTSGSSETPKSIAAGAGFRLPVGDRLTFRLDGRYLHFTDEGGNALAFGLSIGGIFE